MILLNTSSHLYLNNHTYNCHCWLP